MKIFTHKIYFLFFSINILCSLNKIQATHIVGGQMTYTCLGNNKYEITLIIRRDCINGADTVYFDDPAEIGVYYGNGQKAIRIEDNGVFRIKLQNDDTLRENIGVGCFKPGQLVCVHQTIYKKIITLPESELGYILAYQRCCRNMTLSNIVDPLETGSTYSLTITASDLTRCNSSPQFNGFPPIYVCVDKPFTFNHSASDLDGDSLVYSLCTPYLGKTRLLPSGVAEPPPYTNVLFKPQYSLSNILNPNNTGKPLTIDPVTGILNGVPNTQGQFLVGICVDEYRKGIKMSSVLRDFELNVVPCGVKPTAAFDISTDLCNGLTQTFIDKSIGGSSVEWFFDYPNNLNLTSTSSNPTVKYLKEGNYTILLIVNSLGCSDSIQKIIKVIDTELNADFSFTTECSPTLIINAKDSSSSHSIIQNYFWTLTNGANSVNSNLKDPQFKLSSDGTYKLTLIITDINGCKDTTFKNIQIKLIDVELIGGDYTICKGDSVHLVKNPDKNLTYNWSPKSGLNLNDPSDPIASPTNTTTYKVTISDGNCIVEKEVTIFVRGKVGFQVMGDTASCDGSFSLMAVSDSITIFEWSYNSNFNPIEFTGPKFQGKIKGDKIIYVRSGTGDQCKELKAIHLLDHSIDLTYQKLNRLCDFDSINLVLINNKPNDHITIHWFPDSLIISGQGTLNPKLNIHSSGNYYLIFIASNQFGCSFSDTIGFNIIKGIQPDLKVENECGSLKIKVSTNYLGKIIWNFGDGIGSSSKSVDEYTYSKSGRYTITLTADTICNVPSSIVVEVVKLDFNLSDSIVICPGDPAILHVNGNAGFKYHWLPDSCFVDPFIPNPVLKGPKSGKYFVEYFDPLFPSCKFLDSVTVYFPMGYYIASLENVVNKCMKESIVLHVNTNVESVRWCDLKGNTIGVGDSVVILVNSDSVILIKGDFFGCVVYDTVTIKLFEFKSNIVGPKNICPEDTILLSLEPVESDWTYDWTPKNKIIGSSTNSKVNVFPMKDTTFTVVVKNSVGCEWTQSFDVDVSEISNQVFATANPTTILVGGKSQLTTINNSKYTYKWEPNDSSLNSTTIYNPIAMPTKTTSYTVTVTDEFGCSGTASVKVIVGSCDEFVYVPNAFSPNSDGKNDVFLVRALSVKKLEFIVYNRWGQEIFSTTEFGQGWDGTFKGDKLGPDVYGWHLNFTCPDDLEFVRKGNVTLIK
ncbi:MAG: gliding motility-associated C-terminal domain-containing protein [Saprospiraceae bacterium]